MLGRRGLGTGKAGTEIHSSAWMIAVGTFTGIIAIMNALNVSPAMLLNQTIVHAAAHRWTDGLQFDSMADIKKGWIS